MHRFIRRALSVFLVFGITLSCSHPAFAAEAAQTNAFSKDVITETGAYLLQTVKNPQVSSIGGEWAVLGLARSGCAVPQSWYDAYYRNLLSDVQEKNGILSNYKYTEYARVILAATAMGKNPADIGGYNLLEKLGDYHKVIGQGINGPIFALIALDSGNYKMPICQGATVQTTRELLIAKIVSQQLTNGGFALAGVFADPDTTAMALQALAPYQKKDSISNVVAKAIACLSKLQNSNGGYTSYASSGSESAAQVIVALTALGIDPGADSRFIKNGSSVIDNLMTFYVPGGGFRHTAADKEPNNMATEQGFYGLVAYERFLNDKNPLYDMDDATNLVSGSSESAVGLPGKDSHVKVSQVICPGKTFTDISGNIAQKAIEALASRGILNGISDTLFEPGRTMTRAEFATAVIRALGFSPAANTAFSDVPGSSWYAGYVGTANAYGIVAGTSDTEFSPNDTINREQAAVMLARAAKLCGMDTAMTDAEIRDLLAQFADYTASSAWARASLAFCYQNGILSQSVLVIKPKEAVTRAEIAEMIYLMLQKAELI